MWVPHNGLGVVIQGVLMGFGRLAVVHMGLCPSKKLDGMSKDNSVQISAVSLRNSLANEHVIEMIL